MEETFVVDRIEDGIAVCELRASKIMVEIELSELPSDAKEGSVLKYYDGIFSIDYEEQKKIEDRIAEKMDDLWI